MGVHNFDELMKHVNHDIRVVTYGGPGILTADNVAVECVTCNEVLFDFDKTEVFYDPEDHDMDGKGWNVQKPHGATTTRFETQKEALDWKKSIETEVEKWKADNTYIPIMPRNVQVVSPWSDNLVQFARLLCEIIATQEALDLDILCESMDLTEGQVKEIFERAHAVWERAKGTPDKWTREVPLTEEQLQSLRKKIDDQAGEHGSSSGDTCEGCWRRYICDLVWDPYNTNGDCLYDK